MGGAVQQVKKQKNAHFLFCSCRLLDALVVLCFNGIRFSSARFIDLLYENIDLFARLGNAAVLFMGLLLARNIIPLPLFLIKIFSALGKHRLLIPWGTDCSALENTDCSLLGEQIVQPMQ